MANVRKSKSQAGKTVRKALRLMALIPLWSEATPYSSSCAQAFAFSSAKAVIPTTARTVSSRGFDCRFDYPNSLLEQPTLAAPSGHLLVSSAQKKLIQNKKELIEEDECAMKFQLDGCTATASFSCSGIGIGSIHSWADSITLTCSLACNKNLGIRCFLYCSCLAKSHKDRSVSTIAIEKTSSSYKVRSAI